MDCVSKSLSRDGVSWCARRTENPRVAVRFCLAGLSYCWCMPKCRSCAVVFSRTALIRGKRRNLQRRTQCLSCSPFFTEDAKGRRVSRAHPNLDIEYFSQVDTPEKAYWLGFLLADGYVSAAKTYLAVDLAEKDLDQLERFARAVAASENRISRRTHPSGSQSVRLVIHNKCFVSHLVNAGCANAKSLSVRLPALSTVTLDRAVLLGLFDGDGTAGSTTLSSGSRGLLSDIKKRHGVSKPVRRVRPKLFALTLGADVFERMRAAYEKSMPRKRWVTRLSPEERRQNPLTRPLQRKFEVTATELERLLSLMPARAVAAQFKVSGAAIKKRARLLGVETPRRGYWAGAGKK